MLAAVVQSRIAHRLISNFGFTAVQRTFDGGQFSLNSGKNNFTFFGARPTAGILQTDGMPELDIEVYYGAFTRSINTPRGEAQLRVFGLGYVDDRNTILKTDNRPAPVRTADLGLRSGGDAPARLEELSLEEVEAFLIKKALARYEGNVSRAAEALGLSRSALYRRLQRYGL